jgi:hypothetical protein
VTKTVTLRSGDMIWRYGVRSCRKKERRRIRPVCSRNTTSQERKPCSESVHHNVRSAERTLRFRLVTPLLARLPQCPPAAGPPPARATAAKASRTACARSLAATRPRRRATASPPLVESDVLRDPLLADRVRRPATSPSRRPR